MAQKQHLHRARHISSMKSDDRTTSLYAARWQGDRTAVHSENISG